MPKHSIIIEKYRGLSRNQMYAQASKDFSDNGRCWWIKRKILESLVYDEANDWRKVNKDRYNAKQREWRAKKRCQIKKQKLENKSEENLTKTLKD